MISIETWGGLCAALSAAAFIAALGITIFAGIKKMLSEPPAPVPNGRTTRRDKGMLLLMLLGAAALVWAVGLLAARAQLGPGYSTAQLSLHAFQKADALHYINIAENGYTAVGESRYFVVFFPLFPLFVRTVSMLTGLSSIAAAWAVNLPLMYVAILYVYKTALIDHSRKTGLTAAALLLLCPVAFFQHIAYSEALFLALNAMSVFYARRRQYAAAGLIGFFAALSRAAGVLCAVPIVAQAFIDAFGAEKRFAPGRFFKRVWPCVLPLLGIAAYLWMNKIVTGDPFMFLTHQREHWNNGFKLFPNAVKTVSSLLISNTNPYHAALWISSFIAIAVFLVLLVMGARRLPTALSFYNLCYFFMMISSAWLISGPRYLMAMFPAYYAAGLVMEHRPVLRYTVFILCGIGLCVMTWLFAQGHCIY
ncbi:MAG: hypothetical protein IJP30_03435 [Clostridia bacterium]|nr:hypothetical protein [Clostridia bacterium]